jgi:TonB family protein
VNPIYPLLPRIAKIEGIVMADFIVDSEGNTISPNIESGHPMLRGAVLDAISKWKFPKEAANQKVQVSIQFRANCASPQ